MGVKRRRIGGQAIELHAAAVELRRDEDVANVVGRDGPGLRRRHGRSRRRTSRSQARYWGSCTGSPVVGRDKLGAGDEDRAVANRPVGKNSEPGGLTSDPNVTPASLLTRTWKVGESEDTTSVPSRTSNTDRRS